MQCCSSIYDQSQIFIVCTFDQWNIKLEDSTNQVKMIKVHKVLDSLSSFKQLFKR